jgi:hypothetical protein
MEMEVRCFLSAINPVVLKREYSERPIGFDERLCDSLRRDQYSAAFLAGEIEQRRDMAACDHATLADFELPWIDHGERVFAFIDDRPSFFATCHPFAKVARISCGKFDQWPLLVGAYLTLGRCKFPVNIGTDTGVDGTLIPPNLQVASAPRCMRDSHLSEQNRLCE